MTVIEAQYIYEDHTGTPRFKKIRFTGKRFKMRSASWVGNDGRWHYRDGISPMVEMFWTKALYRLPQVIVALKDDNPVWWCEGEKDAESVEALGICATTTPNPSDLWDDQARRFARYHSRSRVVVVVDQDLHGAWWGLERVTRLLSAGVEPGRISVRAPLFPGCKDVTDHLGMGLPLSALREVDLDRLHTAAERYSAARACRYVQRAPTPRAEARPVRWRALDSAARRKRSITTPS